MALTDNLISYWKFDGDATDSKGSNDGTVSGASITTSGKINSAYSFDGTNDSINVGSIALNNKSFSFSMWLANTNSSSTISKLIIGQNSIGSTNNVLHIGRRSNTSKFTFAFYTNDLDSSTNMSTDGTWEHWVCTYNASTNSRKIYRNGTLDNSDTATADYQGTGDLYIGYAPFSSNSYFEGKADEIAIWDKELTSTEVTELYNSGNGLSYPFTSPETSNNNFFTLTMGAEF